MSSEVLNSTETSKEQALSDENEDDGNEDVDNVEEIPSGFKLIMHVAPNYYGGLLGFQGSTKRRIEEKTKTDIYIPDRYASSKEKYIKIEGKLRGTVCEARKEINLLIASQRKLMRPTHFFGIPLNNGEIKNKFNELKKLILSEQLPGIDEQLFQLEGRLHLTLCVCLLLDDGEHTKCIKVLEECRQFLVDLKTPIHFKVSGLDIMNDNPSAVRILYAKVVSPELQQFANRTAAHVFAAGLSNDDRDQIKLHMTILNKHFQGKRNPHYYAQWFDARKILERFRDFHFGTAQFNKVQLCVMGFNVGGVDGYYKVTGSLEF